jgi:hypothetical protein
MLGATAFLALKLPIVLVGFGAAAGIGIASTQVEGGLPAVLGKIKDTFKEAFSVIGADMRSLFTSVDRTLDENATAKPPISPDHENKDGPSFLEKTSKMDFDHSAISRDKKASMEANIAPSSAAMPEKKRAP